MLLLEAGPPDTQSLDPYPARLRPDLRQSEGELEVRDRSRSRNLNNRQLYLPRGKTLGGSSSINGMVYIRGNHGDYDEWRQRGCEGWDWDSVLPYLQEGGEPGARRGRIPRCRRTAACVRSAGTIRTRRGGAGGLRAGRHSAQSGLQRRAAGGLRILPDDNEPTAALEHGEGLSGTGAQPAEPGGANRRACDQGADREQSRRRRRISHRSKADAPRGAAARWWCPAALMARRSCCCCRASVRRSICRTWASPVVKDMPAVGVEPARSFQYLSELALRQGDHAERSGERPGRGRSAPACATRCSAPARWRATAFTPDCSPASDPRLERPDLQINIFEWSTLERSTDRRKAASVPGLHADARCICGPTGAARCD